MRREINKERKINEEILELSKINPIVNIIFKLDASYQNKLEMCVFELAKEEIRIKKQFADHIDSNFTFMPKDKKK